MPNRQLKVSRRLECTRDKILGFTQRVSTAAAGSPLSAVYGRGFREFRQVALTDLVESCEAFLNPGTYPLGVLLDGGERVCTIPSCGRNDGGNQRHMLSGFT